MIEYNTAGFWDRRFVCAWTVGGVAAMGAVNPNSIDSAEINTSFDLLSLRGVS